VTMRRATAGETSIVRISLCVRPSVFRSPIGKHPSCEPRGTPLPVRRPPRTLTSAGDAIVRRSVVTIQRDPVRKSTSEGCAYSLAYPAADDRRPNAAGSYATSRLRLTSDLPRPHWSEFSLTTTASPPVDVQLLRRTIEQSATASRRGLGFSS
jgi:hypothetical protein